MLTAVNRLELFGKRTSTTSVVQYGIDMVAGRYFLKNQETADTFVRLSGKNLPRVGHVRLPLEA